MLSIKQLRETIEEGNDNVDNRLILKLDGEFELVPYHKPRDIEEFENINYITRWDTFDEGNKYVGVDAANDEVFISDIFRWAEKAWSIYNNTGRTKIINRA